MSANPTAFRVIVRRIQPGRVVVERVGYQGRFYLEGVDADLLWPRDICLVENHRSKQGVVIFLNRVNSDQSCICYFCKHKKKFWAIPEDRDLSHRAIDIHGIDLNDVNERVFAQVGIESYHPKKRCYKGRVLSFFEDNGLLSQAIERTVAFFNIPKSFPKYLDTDIEKLGRFKDPVKKRLDLTDYPFVTIDGEDAKDFDDAVFAEKIRDGFRLVVAIAHVSSYVSCNSAVDREAYARGSSMYFPSTVIPMLPEILSENLCSLIPHKTRLVLCCDMVVNTRTKNPIVSYDIYPAKIKSHQRLSYSSVQNYWDGRDCDISQNLLELLDILFGVYTVLKKRSVQRGMLNFDTQNAYFEYSDDRVCNVYHHDRYASEEMIEQCMLAANACVANFLFMKNLSGAVYRNHGGVLDDRLQRIKQLLSLFGMSSLVPSLSTSKGMQKVLNALSERSLSYLQLHFLRSMQHAIYSTESDGHFGLALESYTHFTSPIRRYPDLLVQRALDCYLLGKNIVDFDLSDCLEHCSTRERVSENASRYIHGFLKCCFMLSHIGETFSGMISSVTDVGLFVLLEEYPIEGMIHISKLGRDYFIFDADKFLLVGRCSGRRFCLGDRIDVEVKDVDLSARRIYFSLLNRNKAVAENVSNETERRKKEDTINKKRDATSKKRDIANKKREKINSCRGYSKKAKRPVTS